MRVPLRLVMLLAASSPGPALAGPITASVEEIATQACAHRTTGTLEITRARLAEAIITRNGFLPSDVAGAKQVSGDLVERLNAFRTRSSAELFADESDEARRAILIGMAEVLALSVAAMEAKLAAGQVKDLALAGPSPSSPVSWLFSLGDPSWRLSCAKPEKPGSVIAIFSDSEEPDLIALREKPEELGLTGEPRKKASAFALGFDRKWTEKEDGTTARDTTIKVNGTAGLRLTEPADESPVYAFAQYALNRVRKFPAAELKPGETLDADDTDVLALGLLVDYFPTTTDASLKRSAFSIVSQASYVLDLVDNSERIRLSTKLDLGWGANLGVCNLGYARFFGGDKFGTRCLLRFDAEEGLWAHDGRSTTLSYDDFLAIGANATFEVFYNTGKESALIGSLNYRYLPVLAGQLDDIERVEAELKQRFWAGAFGIDLGFKYVDGTNPLSLKKERTLSFGLGLVH